MRRSRSSHSSSDENESMGKPGDESTSNSNESTNKSQQETDKGSKMTSSVIPRKSTKEIDELFRLEIEPERKR